MARKSILTATERESLIPLPESVEICNQLYEFSREDRNLIFPKRTDPNRLGFAVHLCLLRYPGTEFCDGFSAQTPIVRWVAHELNILPRNWNSYADREETRREHLRELREYLGLKSYGASESELLRTALTERAMQCDSGALLAEYAMEFLFQNQIVVPSVATIEELCATALTEADRRIFELLTESLTDRQKELMDRLLQRAMNQFHTGLTKIRTPITKSRVSDINRQIERLQKIRSFEIPTNIAVKIHRNRLRKIARETNRIDPNHLGKLDPIRRYGMITALLLDLQESVTDELLEQHDKIMGRFFSRTENRFKNDLFTNSKQLIKAAQLGMKLVKTLWEAKSNNLSLSDAIAEAVSWDEIEKTAKDSTVEDFTESAVKLMNEKYKTLRKYAPKLLETLTLTGPSCSDSLLDALNRLREINRSGKRILPADMPTKGLQDSWEKYVITKDGLDRRYYELWLFSEFRDAVKRGDLWVEGSRQFKSPDSFFVSMPHFIKMRDSGTLPVAVKTDFREFLAERISLLKDALSDLDRKAGNGELDLVKLTAEDMTISPLESSVPEEAKDFVRDIAQRMRRIKITELLQEVDDTTHFTQMFTHLKNDRPYENRDELLTVILADGINLGLQKMADACPGMNYDKLSRIQTWHVSDETYRAAIAHIVNHQLTSPIAQIWGDGSTSSSDGQQFRSGHAGVGMGTVNLKYGTGPGRMIYTHISDQYTPFYVNLINVGVRDSTYVLDGLLYHETDMEIKEHYTDTNGFTDHVFALMSLLGFRFAPRIRDIKDRKLLLPEKGMDLPNLDLISGSTIDFALIEENWDEILRLATSIREGTVTASLMMRKLAGYPRQNTLAVALRELGRIERTLFMCDWLRDPALRKRTHAGLNKGEARNALGRAVRIYRQGEFRERSFEQQFFRASGLTLVTDAIIHWNTLELERIVNEMRSEKDLTAENEHLLQHVSPLGWNHIGLTGDYIWKKPIGLE